MRQSKSNPQISVFKSSKEDPVFKRLQQDYEEEFSAFTHYEKGADGLYDQDQLISHWSAKGSHCYEVGFRVGIKWKKR